MIGRMNKEVVTSTFDRRKLSMGNGYGEARLTRSLTMNLYDNSAVNSSIGALICISGEFLGAIFRVKSNKKINFGRDYRVADFCFCNETISKEHCWVEYDAITGKYVICDTSLNGVFLNGDNRLEKNKKYYLKKGDEIRLGKTDNVFKMG
ncbi:MAG: FHA domain-containing protein [Lachnospiraceae bacterium]|nr:FHA domain-containing protein [Lachnospiraceae bacterium]